MTLIPTALPRPAQATAIPKADRGLAASLLIHALGAAGWIAASLSAPSLPPPAPVIELLALPHPDLPPSRPIQPSPLPAPARPAPRPHPAPPPAIVRDASALAPADTLVAPPADTVAITDATVTYAIRSAASQPALQGNPGGTGPSVPSGAPGGAGAPESAGLKGELVSITRLTRMPVLTVASKPEYSTEMKRRNLAGKLKAKVLVDSDGKVKDAVVLSDLGYGTREAGLAALRKLEFDPGFADGNAVAVWIPFTFTFEWQE